MTKIAFATDDLKTISSHFGQARKYLVCSIENHQVTAREEREKAAHHHGRGEGEHGHHGRHHEEMARSIADCQFVVARGMGSPAYESMKQAGVQPILTQFQTIEEALSAYLEGKLEHQDKRVHVHQ